jgi:hypothetical protein
LGESELNRPIFKLRVRAEPSIDVVRSLRAWLKVGLRTFGLRCVSIEEVKQQESDTMDMRKYSSGFIKPDDVRDGPLQAHIINVFISEKYDRPVLELDTGDQFTVNATNNRMLCKAYGPNSEDWRGHVVEFSLDHYKDRKTDPPEEKETVALKAISPREGAAGNGGSQRIDPAKLPAPSEMNDEIPF